MMSNRVQTSSLIGNSKVLNEVNLEAAHECKYSNYWVAYDALESMNKNYLDAGIELAKDMQKAIV